MPHLTTDIAFAVSLLKRGEIVAIPTETVYGLAAIASNPDAIKKVFDTKKRPLNHPLILHICEPKDLSTYTTSLPSYVSILVKAFWPGALTLVCYANEENVSSLVRGGVHTVAIRCPKHPLTSALLTALNEPIVAPSANPYEKISATSAAHVMDSFPLDDFWVLDGGRCESGVESTILDVTDKEGYRVLRYGAISLAEIEQALPNKCLKGASYHPSPGQAKKHYQPKTPLYYTHDASVFLSAVEQEKEKQSLYLISFQALPSLNLDDVYDDNVQKAQFSLYAKLRAVDNMGKKKIFVLLPPPVDPWLTICDKFYRAGEKIT